MIIPKPTWIYETLRPFHLWYGPHSYLLPNNVVGTWFCLERESYQDIRDFGNSSADILYHRKTLDCGNGKTLYRGIPGKTPLAVNEYDWKCQLYLTDKDNNILWQFDGESPEHFVRGNYYSYRYFDKYIYLLVSDKPYPNPSRYVLWILEVDTGNISQKVQVDENVKECSIEDIDIKSLLIGCEPQALILYSREEKKGNTI